MLYQKQKNREMDSLAKRSYDAYVENLSVPKKKKLIGQIQKSIDDEYDQWCAAMEKFLEGTKFQIRRKFDAYSVSRKDAVLFYDSGPYAFAFYVTTPGEIQTTDWDDMGFPSTESIRIAGDGIREWCKKRKFKPQLRLEEILTLFATTHPDLK